MCASPAASVNGVNHAIPIHYASPLRPPQTATGLPPYHPHTASMPPGLLQSAPSAKSEQLANRKEHTERKDRSFGQGMVFTRQMNAPVCPAVSVSLGSLRSLWLICSASRHRCRRVEQRLEHD
jgi:hypothetical protein